MGAEQGGAACSAAASPPPDWSLLPHPPWPHSIPPQAGRHLPQEGLVGGPAQFRGDPSLNKACICHARRWVLHV